MTRNSTDLAYMAGIMDGEGSISILGEHGRSLGLSVVLGSTCFSLLEWVETTFGGTLDRRPDKQKVLSRKPFWRWYIRGDNAVEFLEAIRPYMRIKHVHAWLACEGWAHRNATKGRKPLNEETRAIRAGFYLAMRYLNGRVPQDTDRLPNAPSHWGPVTVHCTICGKEFTRTRSRIKESGNVLCSTACLRVFQRRNLSGARWGSG